MNKVGPSGIGSGPPAPESLNRKDDTIDADETFQDDVVGARAKKQESAKRKAAADRSQAVA